MHVLHPASVVFPAATRRFLHSEDSEEHSLGYDGPGSNPPRPRDALARSSSSPPSFTPSQESLSTHPFRLGCNRFSPPYVLLGNEHPVRPHHEPCPHSEKSK